MLIKKILLTVGIVMFGHSLHAETIEYVVNQGETLSDILNKLNINPIYGKNGYLKKVIALNPPLVKSFGNKITPGRKIKLMQIDSVKKDISSSRNQGSPTVESARPTEAVTNTSSINHEQYSFIRVEPQISWMKTSSSSTNQYQISKISALSKASPGITASFGINVREDISVRVFSFLSKVNFYDDTRYNILRKSFSRKAYGIGGEYRLNTESSLSFQLGFFDEFYLTMNDLSVIDIAAAEIPEFHLGHHRELGQYKDVTMSSSILGKIILPYEASSINGKLGYGLGGDILLMLKNKGLRFFYNYSDVKAENKSTKNFELGWNILFVGKMYE